MDLQKEKQPQFHNQDQKEHQLLYSNAEKKCPWVFLFLTQPDPFRDQRGDVCQSWASTGLPISRAGRLQWCPRAWEQNMEEKRLTL